MSAAWWGLRKKIHSSFMENWPSRVCLRLPRMSIPLTPLKITRSLGRGGGFQRDSGAEEKNSDVEATSSRELTMIQKTDTVPSPLRAFAVPTPLPNSIKPSCVQTAICGEQCAASNGTLAGLHTVDIVSSFNYGKNLTGFQQLYRS